MSSGLHLHTSNRLETLSIELARLISSPLADPFTKETIIVQSRGMERWLSLQLASQNGIVANLDTPFPTSFINKLIRSSGIVPEDYVDPFNRDRLLFLLMRILPECRDDDRFQEINHYLADDEHSLKGFQLAQRLAALYDTYGLYRYQMLSDWREVDSSDWQVLLWQRLLLTSSQDDRGQVRQRLLRTIVEREIDRELLPERISLFGIPTLPPFLLELFAALAELIPVHIFALNPCAEYWFDLVSEKTLAKWRLQAGRTTEHVDSGHQLLASLGQRGREFFSSLLSRFEPEWHDYFLPAENDLMLHVVQNELLDLQPPIKGSVAEDDCSIRFFSCHSPMREVEVLHDQLLKAFSDLDDLAPRDILVMTPEIETYAPYIAAVFGGNPDESTRIPFSIADRSTISEHETVATFWKIIGICRGRFTLSEVLDLLEQPSLRHKFSLNEEQISTIRELAETAAIRWGIDAEHRQSYDIPPFEQNSWQMGIDRMLLGWALSDQEPFFALLPLEGVEGGRAELAGILAELIALLGQLRKDVQLTRPFSEWSQLFQRLLTDLFDPEGDGAEGLLFLSTMLHELDECATESDHHQPVSIEVVASWINDRLAKEGSTYGFITGSVTFCALLPMRSIPFRVVALLGMNDTVFPRIDKRLSFDMMDTERIAGDPDRRGEDRYLFLESLISARDRLLISYVGQNPRDNSQMPPSVVVSELLDNLESRFALPRGRDSLIEQHRLQAFSPAYFTGGPLFSYAQEPFQGAKAHAVRDTTEKSNNLELGFAQSDRLELTPIDLCRFFRAPADWFVQHCLGASFVRLDDQIEDREPFAINHLNRYQLMEQLLSADLTGDAGVFDRIPYGGVVPPGRMGELDLMMLQADAGRYADRVRCYQQGEKREVRIDYSSHGVHISGDLTDIFDSTQLLYRPAKLKGFDHVRGWLLHLLLNASTESQFQTVVIGSDKTILFQPPEDSGGDLQELLRLVLEGHRSPLPFFPETSFNYARRLAKDGEDKALQAARDCWQGSRFSRAECDDRSSYPILWPETDPLDNDFAELATRIYLPILTAMEKQ